MAAKHYRYKRDTLEYTPEGLSAVDIEGLTGLRFGEGGETTDLMSDASELVEEGPLGRIKGRLTVTSLNQIQAAGLPLGAGAITFIVEQVKTGRGAVSGEDQAITFPNLVLKDKDVGVGSVPGESATLTFDAYPDEDGNIYTIEDAA